MNQPDKGGLIDDATRRLLLRFQAGTLSKEHAETLGELLKRKPEWRAFLLSQSAKRSTKNDSSSAPAPDSSAKGTAKGIPKQLRDYREYKIIRKIDYGSTGAAWLARNVRMDRDEVLVVLGPELAGDKQIQKRILEEIRLASRLNHPSIVTCYNILPLDGLIVFAMEHVGGISLHKLIEKKGQIAIPLAVSLTIDVAAGLEHAHSQQLVHLGIKPASILVYQSSGQWHGKILDFGIAKACSETSSDGTPSKESITEMQEYMAPELSLNGQLADIRADIYSLGSTLYHMLAGQSPYKGTPGQKLLAHARSAPAALQTLRTDLRAGLINAVLKMMAKNPDARLESPKEVISLLQPFLETPVEVVRARPAKIVVQQQTVHSDFQDEEPSEFVGSVFQTGVPGKPKVDPVIRQRSIVRKSTNRANPFVTLFGLVVLIASTCGLGWFVFTRYQNALSETGVVNIGGVSYNSEFLLNGVALAVEFDARTGSVTFDVPSGSNLLEIRENGHTIETRRISVRDGRISQQVLSKNHPQLASTDDRENNGIVTKPVQSRPLAQNSNIDRSAFQTGGQPRSNNDQVPETRDQSPESDEVEFAGWMPLYRQTPTFSLEETWDAPNSELLVDESSELVLKGNQGKGSPSQATSQRLFRNLHLHVEMANRDGYWKEICFVQRDQVRWMVNTGGMHLSADPNFPLIQPGSLAFNSTQWTRGDDAVRQAKASRVSTTRPYILEIICFDDQIAMRVDGKIVLQTDSPILGQNNRGQIRLVCPSYARAAFQQIHVRQIADRADFDNTIQGRFPSPPEQ